jgi:predicted enzyme related to lactoylglutathione lyase
MRRRLVVAAATMFVLLAGTTHAEKLPPIGNGKRLPGKFVWADLVTYDVPGSAKFYKGLFGWNFTDYGGYVIVDNEERPIAGMFQKPKPADSQAKPRWFGYISVPNVARVQETVTKAGGRVLAAPQKFPGRGEQAVFADPEGALFGVIRSSSGDPADYEADVGDWIWIQMWSRNSRKSADFYRSVGGYEIDENTVSARSNDYVLVSERYARGTVLQLPDTYADVKPTWLLFVRVKDVAESCAKVPELGGKVLIPPSAELYQNHVAAIADPTGAAIGLMQWSEQVLTEGK